ncbi:asparagine synthase-domain-containing protein [Suillus paluster]|uniref:asparagine synthase-domain-containing protein n=1 Tax=Suillus paluster TaxID=48578 RepID=UPI001B872F04|nr:asparagine synthase-domain-containing protein [Suillus paluster]KAG1755068.1 asparagine synthase-domain-containing protein [Suillus paluster]
MCGIICSLRAGCRCDTDNTTGPDDAFRDLLERLKVANAARGPDVQESHRVRVQGACQCDSGEAQMSSPIKTRGLDLEFFASELRLRGDAPIVQPHQQDGDVFCWNGEVFEGLSVNVDENDGTKLFQSIRSLSAMDDLPLLLGKIEGPDTSLEELSTEGIFCLDVGKMCESNEVARNFDSSLSYIPRHTDQQSLPFAKLSRVNTAFPPDAPPFVLSLDSAILPHELAIAYRRLRRGRHRSQFLFSGGIDSTMLAFLAHRHVPLDEPIDLLNVAFENPRKIQVQTDGNMGAIPKREKKRRLKATEQNGSMKESTPYMVPDRVTGLQEVEELRQLCQGRTWNFESQSARAAVEAIMFPGRTVMDLSLAMALYFASKGVGRVRISAVSDDYQPYASTARVLLNGLGSDELLGGYGRHRTVYATRGWQGVIDELQLELDRIPTRNLGRDDRVISSHGKETRHPFLSLTVVSFLAGLPVHLKLDPRLELGLGDKMLLRLAARKVGLLEASARKKRAMQFGSHSARMEGGEGERRGDLTIRAVSEQ